ncbi:ATP synthase subunit delta [Bacteroidia bacterium]|nr:ATP synthase subunit delta [Bacteroidia bacterium]
MDTGVISTRYARAIYNYAAETGNETALYREMQLLAKNFTAFPTLREVMNDPTVAPEQKIRVLTTACGMRPNETLKQILQLIIGNKRANYMENIALMYDKVYRKAKGIVIVQLTTVEKAGEETKEALLPVIAQATGGQIEFHTETNPDLIGGFILEIEDKRLDASVKNQVNTVIADLIRNPMSTVNK